MNQNKILAYILLFVGGIGIFSLIGLIIFGINFLLFLCSWSTTQVNCLTQIAILLVISFVLGIIFVMILKRGLKSLKSGKTH